MGFFLYKLNSSFFSILSHFVNYLHCAFHSALSFSFMLCSCAIHQGSKALSCEKLRAAYQLNRSSYNNRTTTVESARKQTNKQAARQKETDKRLDALLVCFLEYHRRVPGWSCSSATQKCSLPWKECRNLQLDTTGRCVCVCRRQSATTTTKRTMNKQAKQGESVNCNELLQREQDQAQGRMRSSGSEGVGNRLWHN